MSPSVFINKHTTASSPRPHILYTVETTRDGTQSAVTKRYSDFVALHNALNVKEHALPPKRIITTTFIPSAWVDDSLISERKAGLATYLSGLLQDPQYSNNSSLNEFLTAGSDETGAARRFDPEDALPSTLSRKTALDLLGRQGQAQAEEVEAAASNLIAAAYYPDWSSSAFAPEKLDYSKFDILFFAFATPSSGHGVSIGSTSLLKRLVTAAKNSGKGTRVVLSVGGWGGCQYYSSSVTSANRTTFVNALASAISTYNLDGIDFDWEFPNNSGAGQPYSSADSANFLSTLQALRAKIGTGKLITAAVSHETWLGSNGNPLKDVSAYAAVMDYINIMNYDVWGATSTPGPNAPLGNLCGTSTQPVASAQGALASWKNAKWPVSKMILGLPLYGYVSKSSKTTLTGSFAPNDDMVLLRPPEAGKDINGSDNGLHFLNVAHPRTKQPVPAIPEETVTAEGEVEAAKANANLTSWYGQQIPFSSIVSSGALVKGSDGNYTGAGGFTMAWDNCSDTPYLYNTSQKTVVTYDDTWSLADKAAYAKSSGMAGCMTWSLDQDDGVTLQNVIRKSLGK